MKAQLRSLIGHIGGKAVKSATRDSLFAGNFKKLAALRKATDDESSDGPIFAALAELHEAAQADAVELATHCGEFAKLLDKSAGFDDLDALQPTEISAVVPSNLRPIFRAGQREFSLLDKSDKANETLSKITSLD